MATVIFQSVFEPPGEDKPKKTRSGGSRTELSCQPNQPPIYPLLPSDHYGLTLQARPEIFMQLSGLSGQQIVFVIQDTTDSYYERSVMTIPEAAGIVKVMLPPDAPELTIGKNYQWSVSVICNDFLRPNDPVFQGWVQRTGMNKALSQQAQTSTLQKLQWLGAQGYWYDLLNQLNQLDPSSQLLQGFWQNYLEGQEQPNSQT